jgi:hypothetical protein
MGGLFAIDTPGPQRFTPIVGMIYSQVVAQTFNEAIERNGLYLTVDQSIPSIQTAALLLPAGMIWNAPVVETPTNG